MSEDVKPAKPPKRVWRVEYYLRDEEGQYTGTFRDWAVATNAVSAARRIKTTPDNRIFIKSVEMQDGELFT